MLGAWAGVLVTLSVVVPQAVFGVGYTGPLVPPSPVADAFPGPAQDILTGLGRIIRVVLLLVGVLALGFVVYGGFRYMIARGEERDLTAAKQTITQAVIAVAIIGLAYGIVEFAFFALGAV